MSYSTIQEGLQVFIDEDGKQKTRVLFPTVLDSVKIEQVSEAKRGKYHKAEVQDVDGLRLRSPDGTEWIVQVDNSGTLFTTEV